MTSLLDATCASLPPGALPLLAGLRDRPGVRIKPMADRLWVFWEPGEEEVTQAVHAIHGAEVFCLREGHWYPPGQHLPAFHVPPEDGAFRLPALLSPAPVQPERCLLPFWKPIPITLVREGNPRPTSALCCRLSDLEPWSSAATTFQLSALQAAWRGERVLLLGSALPPGGVPGQRYWGRDVLVPLGWRPEPLLPDAVFRAALELQPEEVALFEEQGVERIPRSVFGPLTRAGVRIALRGPKP